MAARAQFEALHPRQWRGRQAARLAPGAFRTAHCRRGATLDRRLLSQRQLHAQQERDWSASVAQRGAGTPRSSARKTGRVTIDMVKCRQRKRDMVDRQIAAHTADYKESGAGLDHGGGAFRGAENARGAPQRRRDARADSRPGLPQRRHTRDGPRCSWTSGREPLTNIEALELDHVPPHLIVLGGGLCRSRIRPSVPSLRKPRDDHRARVAAFSAERITTFRRRCSEFSAPKGSNVSWRPRPLHGAWAIRQGT